MYRKINLILLLAPFLLGGLVTQAQLVTDNSVSPADAVDILLGEGIMISNLEFSGDDNQIGSFECTDCGISMENGVVIATGDVVVAEGPNNSTSASEGGGNGGASDPDLETIQANLNDAAILEFDFVATGDSVQFNYVWASEEYPEFVPQNGAGGINDVFGFYLSGPGINGPFQNNAINIAEIPGTTQAVSIANLNNGYNDGGPCTNCEFYIENNGNTDPNTIQFDGYTVSLTAIASGLQCGETYHIKIAIADASDTVYDSAVFLEAESFESNAVFIEGSGNINPDEPNFLGDTTLIEGCNTGSFSVFRPTATDTTTINFDLFGTAENGVDYTEIPEFVFLDSGETSVEINVQAIADGMDEDAENVVLQYTYLNSCGDVDTTSASLTIVDYIEPVLELQGSGVACPNAPTALTANVVEGMGTYFYNWSTGDTTSTIEVLPDTTTQYFAEVTDLCGTVVEDSISISVDYTPLEISPEEYTVTCPGGSTEITVNPTNGSPSYMYDWANIELPDTSVVTVTPLDQEFTEYDVTITDQCGEIISTTVTVFLENYDIQPIIASPDTLCAGTNGSIQPITGGTGTFTFGTDVEGISLNDDGTFVTSASLNDTLEIAITDECGNFGFAEVVVEVCDTSIPNIITPNGDNKNDVFWIEGLEGFRGSSLLIKNRWGVTIFESSDYRNDWDGTTSSGEDVEEGTYYYIFKRTDGQDFSGYLQISR